jgi:hypothetical protein
MGKTLEADRRTSIYVLKDPFTLEIRYVGKTVVKLSTRLSGHKDDTKRPTNHRLFWFKSVLAKGSLPLIEEIDFCPWSESQALEIKYIKEFREKGYRMVNTSDGGEGTLGLKRRPESNRLNSNTQRAKSKPVYQYTLAGLFVQQFRSSRDARDITGINAHTINCCCNFVKKTAGGFIWSYLDAESIDFSKYTHLKVTINVTENNSFKKKQRQVLITTLTGNQFIAKSLTEAAILTEVSKATICRNCKNMVTQSQSTYKFNYYNGE